MHRKAFGRSEILRLLQNYCILRHALGPGRRYSEHQRHTESGAERLAGEPRDRRDLSARTGASTEE